MADRAPTMAAAITAAKTSGGKYLCLDATLIPTDRVAATKDDERYLGVPPTCRGNYCGKHKRLGVDIEVILGSRDFPL